VELVIPGVVSTDYNKDNRDPIATVMLSSVYGLDVIKQTRKPPAPARITIVVLAQLATPTSPVPAQEVHGCILSQQPLRRGRPPLQCPPEILRDLLSVILSLLAPPASRSRGPTPSGLSCALPVGQTSAPQPAPDMAVAMRWPAVHASWLLECPCIELLQFAAAFSYQG